MKTRFQSFSPLALLAAVLLLAACQMLPMESSATDGPADSDSSQTAVDAEAEAPATDEVSASMPESVDEDDGPMATIVVASLRLRTGPGIEYDVLGAALSGETFSVLGQAFNCQWLTANHPSLGVVWFSGAPQYTAMNVVCDQVAPAEAPAAPTPRPVEEAPNSNEPAQPTVVEATVEEAIEPPAEADAQPTEEAAAPAEPAQPPVKPTPEPTVEAAAVPQAQPSLSESASPEQEPVEQGCYLIQGYAGPELTIEVSAIDWDWSGSFRFSGDSNQPYCFAPGRYNVSIVAPAIWKGLGTQLDVQSGLHTLTPADLLQ